MQEFPLHLAVENAVLQRRLQADEFKTLERWKKATGPVLLLAEFVRAAHAAFSTK